ncbi:MAG: putative 3-hydroxyacyl-CoA dehydrogenase [Fibrobacteres bacterium]|nr:putative 3-hydroxyacyl-CoA dehydrogenase [Fibrobacterota bacterium]
MMEGAKGAEWSERMRAVAVLGAGGKMGSGIAWVALKAMAESDAKENGVPGSGRYDLVLIDANPESFRRLRGYLRTQLVKVAEKGIGDLRAWAKDRADLIENGEIIDAYVDGAMSMVRCEGDVTGAKGAKVVFEAVFEDLALKKELYSRLKALCAEDTFFLTNTSSIPISLLDQSAGLGGRILGFHFYNPPAVQKLVEMISGRQTRPELTALGRDLGKAFGKITVPAHDVAGFIGNGHFIRELLFAFGRFREMRAGAGATAGLKGPEALVTLNKATQDYLIRPMGLFQLLDYVGLDVFQMILKVMREHLDAKAADGVVFVDPTLDALLAAGVRGGQLGSGEQKDGLFKYERNRIAGVLDIDAITDGADGADGAEGGQGTKGAGIRYVSLGDDRFRAILDDTGAGTLGAFPVGHAPWSNLAKDPARKEKLAAYLAKLAESDAAGAVLARRFLARSRAIGATLVATGVADTHEDVSKVLMNGFFHLYGPADWTH